MTTNSVEPPILTHPIWPQIKKYFSRQKDATKVRAHFSLQPSIPETLAKKALAVRIPCIRCGEQMHPFRIHANSRHISMHVTCLRSDHQRCSYGSLPRGAVAILQHEIGQGTKTDRVRRIATGFTSEDKNQRMFKVKKGKDGLELMFDDEEL